MPSPTQVTGQGSKTTGWGVGGVYEVILPSTWLLGECWGLQEVGREEVGAGWTNDLVCSIF